MTNAEYIKKFVEKTRDQLREGYAQLTPEQANLFDRMYGSIEGVSYDKMPWAYSQIQKTLESPLDNEIPQPQR